MTELMRLTKKVWQIEDKVKDCRTYLEKYGPDDYGYRNEQKKLARYEEELKVAKAEYDALPKLEDVPVIKTYLENWAKMVRAWVERCHDEYPAKDDELKAREAEFKKVKGYLNEYSFMTDADRREFNRQNWSLIEEVEGLREGWRMWDGIDEFLERDIELKYIKLVQMVKDITGSITDATLLRANEKGELDGIIIGENGTAKVNTFGAGGWNIQRFHYRTKVTKIA